MTKLERLKALMAEHSIDLDSPEVVKLLRGIEADIRDARLAHELELWICSNTKFNGNPPYVGDAGLVYALDEMKTQKDLSEAQLESIVKELDKLVIQMDCDEKGKPYVYTKPSMVIWTWKWQGWVDVLRKIIGKPRE